MIQLNSNTYFFAAGHYEVPQFLPDDRGREEWIPYGKKNEYPEYLLDLYNTSSKHGGIIEAVNKMVSGQGMRVSSSATIEERTLADMKVKKINNYGESLWELVQKLQADRKIFGGFAFRVVKTRMGGEMFFHVPFQKVRKHKSVAVYAVSDNWQKRGGKKVGLDYEGAYTLPAYRKGANYSESLYCHKDYRAGMTEYPLPDYVSCIPYIECDKELGKFNRNNVMNGFLGGFLINFPNGTPTDEERGRIEQMVKSKFAGSEGDRLLMDFSNGKDMGVTITPLTPPDLASQFATLNEQINNEIYTGHAFPKVLLGVGDVTGLSFGEQSQLRMATESFTSRYVTPMQNTYIDLFNWILGVNCLEFIPLDEIGLEVPEWVQRERMTNAEVRAMYGLEVVREEQEEEVDGGLASALGTISPLVATKVLETMTTNEIRGIIGLPPAPNGITRETSTTEQRFSSHQCTDGCGHSFSENEDFSLFDEYGITEDAAEILDAKELTFTKVGDTWRPVIDEAFRVSQYRFADLSERKQRILSILDEEPDTSINDIAEALGEDAETILDDIKEMQVDGYLSDELKPTREGREELPEQKVEVRYRYALRADAPALKGESRPFCQEMMRRGRLYTREEIDTLSARYSSQLGRTVDVWLMRGGWYTNSRTKRHVPFCRHIWNSVIVRKR